MAPHQPIRTCVGCRATGRAATMVRFVARDGALIAGAGQSGRGAWLCAATLLDCYDQATRQRSWARALRCSIENDAVVHLRAQLADATRTS